MTAWLIYNEFEAVRNSFLIGEYFKECRKRNINLLCLLEERIETKFVDGENIVICCGQKLDKPNFIVCRTINQNLSEFLNKIAPVFNNPTLAKIANDKWLALKHVESLNLKIPNSRIVQPNERIIPLEYPKVIKPVDGKGGYNVFWVENEEQFENAKSSIGTHPFIIQETMDKGRDLRVYVVDKRVIGAVLRKNEHSFKANFCLGGQAQPIEIDGKIKGIVNIIVNSLDIGFVGVDFMFKNGEPVFNEIEDVVGSRMLYEFTKINPVKEYIESIIAKIS